MIAMLLQMAAIPPLSLAPFYDRPAAAEALEAAMGCLAEGVYSRRNDARSLKLLADEVRQACKTQANELRAELTTVFEHDPKRMPSGSTASDAANIYVAELLNRVDAIFEEERANEKANNVAN